jgi:hypothetical protein
MNILVKVSFLKYSGLLDYLVYCFPPVCIGWKSAVYTPEENNTPDSQEAPNIWETTP